MERYPLQGRAADSEVHYDLGNFIALRIRGNVILDKKTAYQHIQIIDTEDGNRYLLLDSLVQFSKIDEYMYHESIVHPAMLSCPSPKRILVLGGGDGGALREILRYDIDSVILCELDKEMIDISRDFFPEVSSGAFDDPKVEIVEKDGRKFIEESEKKFDVIIVDLTDPTGPSKLLYTKEFYSIALGRLNHGGVLIIDADTPDLDGLFANVIKTVESVFTYVYPFFLYIPGYFLRQGFALCSNSSLDTMKDPEEVKKRMESKKISLRMYEGRDISNLFNTTKLARSLLSGDYRVSTDDSPLEIFIKGLR
jgi:spermidine synthase